MLSILRKLARKREEADLRVLARAILSERAGHKGSERLRALVGEEAAAGGGRPQGPAQEGTLPDELTTPLALYREQPVAMDALARELRAALRAASYERYQLPERFHLSGQEGERLLTVLALERRPEANYLRWLSERVWIENAVVGFMAAQALWTAALRLEPGQVPRVQRAATWAADQLDQGRGPSDPLEGKYDNSRLKTELRDLLTLLDMRSQPRKGNLAPTDLDRFLAALVRTFDLNGLVELFRVRLGTPLKLHVRLDAADPMEIVVAKVAIKARQVGWEQDLIQAAYAQRPEDPTLQALSAKVAKPA